MAAGSHQIPARSRPQELLRRAKEPKTGVEEEDRAGQARGSKRAGTLLCCCCCWFWLVSAWQEGERERRERRRLKRGGSCEEVVTLSWPKACRVAMRVALARSAPPERRQRPLSYCCVRGMSPLKFARDGHSQTLRIQNFLRAACYARRAVRYARGTTRHRSRQ